MARKQAGATKEKPSAGSMRLEAFKKTRLCKFYVAGNCVRGTSCNFAHTVDQIRDQPDYSKTRLCANYLQSRWCRDGQYCKFAHGEHELRPHPSAKPKDQTIKVPGEMPAVAQYMDEEGDGSDRCDGWYVMAEGMAMMYPWCFGYPLVDFPMVQQAWETTSHLSTDWTEWGPTSSGGGSVCMESPLQSCLVLNHHCSCFSARAFEFMSEGLFFELSRPRARQNARSCDNSAHAARRASSA